ncbi:MAG: hypothetical protein WBQ44_22245 [Rhodococcus sp. (in: high G+C Gram-positive bacteria)]
MLFSSGSGGRAAPSTTTGPATPTWPTVVFIPGKDRDRVGHSDVALAEALTQFVRVLWIDPADDSADVDGGVDGGVSSPFTGLRMFVRSIVPRVRPIGRGRDHAMKARLRTLGVIADAVVLTDPVGRFPRGVSGHRLLYVTDDWVRGAPEAGLSRRRVRRALQINVADADTVAAVSETLALRLHVYSKDMGAVRVVPRTHAVMLLRLMALFPDSFAIPAKAPGHGRDD